GDVDYALVVSRKGATAYRADDGTVAWDRPGAGSSISSSVVLGDRLLLPYDGLLLLDVSGEAPADVWSSPRMRPSNTSPVVSGNTIYLLSSSGVLTGVDLSTGERAWQARVGGSFWSTPVVSGDHLYAFSEAGMAIIVRLDGANSENVAEYDLGAPILASPAAAGDALFVRTDNALWKFSTK
ncbi:MAG TPA: PQQ-binding-like beta-propeller repeat protein, partial [Pirellulaceae bacterium]|nr:PQQ-binding-like beta-propeller repeat protein [Pirellulaceae bacterium]